MKIVFVTFHNWETKRIGGFHKFAEACADKGHEVIFFSAARPYFIRFKHEERLNKEVLNSLSKGVVCKTEKGNTIINCTWPTLRIPMPFYKFIPHKINRWFNSHSLGLFSTFQHKFLDNTDVFVFESCDCLDLFDKIKKNNPDSKFVYRPSDPLAVSDNKVILYQEYHVLKECDLSFIVNPEGLELYHKTYLDFHKNVKYQILSNGVDSEKYSIKYPVPHPLQKENTALYVGARDAQWDLILYSAKQCPDINFVIVCPEKPTTVFLNSNLANITYIQGIAPTEVPAWITNCDVVIIPNPTGRWKKKPWGITAKYYQAMKAKKPIVSYEDTPRLKTDFNVNVAYSFADFVTFLRKEMKNKGEREYTLKNKEWTEITNIFIDCIKSL